MTATRHPQSGPGHPPRQPADAAPLPHPAVAAQQPPASASAPKPLGRPARAIAATDNRKAARAARAATRARRDVQRPATVAGTLRRALGRPAREVSPAPIAPQRSPEDHTRATGQPPAITAAPIAPQRSPEDHTRAIGQAPEAGRPGQPSAAQPLAPGVAAEHLRARGLTASPAERRRRRRKRLAGAAGTLAVIAAAWVAIDRSAQPPSPEQVAERIHESVQRDAAAQSGDPTIKVGKLDCVEIAPGRGNCLADATSSWRPMEGMMLAVSYEPDPRTGDLSWSLRLP